MADEMASYNPEMSTDRDKVRFLIGDTGPTFTLVNSEIDFLLTIDSGIFGAARSAVTGILAKLSGTATTKSIGPFSMSSGEKVQHYNGLMMRLKELEAQGAVPWASGWVRSEKDAREQDLDREQTFGRKGQHDNPDALGSDWEWYRRYGA